MSHFGTEKIYLRKQLSHFGTRQGYDENHSIEYEAEKRELKRRFPVSYRSKQGKNISFLPIAPIKSGNHFRGMLPLRPFGKHILTI